ncbi:MAG: glycosyltransferase family 39 protein [bacterium]
MLPILHQSYWRDEAWNILTAQKSLSEIFALTLKDVHPPLFAYLLHFWIKLFGSYEYVTRVLPLIFHFLLVLVVFFLLLHLLKNWKASLLGAGAVLINPFLLIYAFELKAYSMFAFFTATALFFFLKRKYILSSIFLALMLLVHNFAFLFFTPFMVFWVTQATKYSNNKRLKEGMKLFLFPLVVFGFWLSFLWNQWVSVASGFWLENSNPSIFVEAFQRYARGVVDYPGSGMLYGLSLVLLFLSFGFWLLEIKKINLKELVVKHKEILFIFLLIFFPFLFTYLVSWFWIPIYHERYLIPALPLFIIFIVYSLYKLSRVKTPLMVLVLSFGVAYLLFGWQVSEEILRKTTKPPINDAVSQVLPQVKEGDIIIPKDKLNFLETKFYVENSGSKAPVYMYFPDGDIPFYLGYGIFFEDKDVIKELPTDKRIWYIENDGGFSLKEISQ